MPDQFPEYHAARDTAVNAVIQNESDRDTLNGAFCVGANGESLASYTYDSGISGIDTVYQDGCDFGIWAGGQNPKRPIPPPPPPPDLTGSL
jgi:hypothetical protein